MEGKDMEEKDKDMWEKDIEKDMEGKSGRKGWRVTINGINMWNSTVKHPFPYIFIKLFLIYSFLSLSLFFFLTHTN